MYDTNYTIFHSSGNSQVFNEVLYRMVSAPTISTAVSFSTLGCIISEPGDLYIFMLINFFKITSSLVSTWLILLVMEHLFSWSRVLDGSRVKTCEKYSVKAQAFSLPSVTVTMLPNPSTCWIFSKALCTLVLDFICF